MFACDKKKEKKKKKEIIINCQLNLLTNQPNNLLIKNRLIHKIMIFQT